MSNIITTITIFHGEAAADHGVKLIDHFNEIISNVRYNVSGLFREVSAELGGSKYSGLEVLGTTFNGDFDAVDAVLEAFIGFGRWEYPEEAVLVYHQEDHAIRVLRPGYDNWIKEAPLRALGEK